MAFTSNFAFVAPHSAAVAALGARAEQYFTDDPNTCLIKLRQLIEVVVKELVSLERVYVPSDAKLADMLRELSRSGKLDRYAEGLLRQIRKAGNDAVHGTRNRHQEAADQLRNARSLAIWYVEEYFDASIKPAPFQFPPAPRDAAEGLKTALAEKQRLMQELEASVAQREAFRAQVAAQAERLAKPQVVIQDALLGCYAGLEEDNRARLKARLLAFQENPGAFELVSFGEAVDDKLSWVILDGDWTMVVATAPNGDSLLCLWVGTYDQAPTWAAYKRVDVHPELGVLQVYDVTPTLTEPTPKAFLADFSDDELLHCGVPPLLMPALRALSDATALPGLAAFLPTSVADALYALLGGSTVEQVRREAGLTQPRQAVDTSDFGAALGHTASRQHFVRVDDAALLEAMLDAPLETWRTFLHPSQRRIVRTRSNGPVRVLGGAGTGKTVALLHRAVFLLREVFPAPDHRLLITTYTSNLAQDLKDQLQGLTTEAERARVDVVHLHKWAFDLLRAQGVRFKIAKTKQRKDWMKQALAEAGPADAFPLAFYQEEWDQVVQSQGITTKQAYWSANRQGRGTRLNRRRRSQTWKVFARYRALMDARGVMEWPDFVRRARTLLAEHPTLAGYQAVLSDEIQDFSAEELRLLRAIVPSQPYDLFLVGDAHQRIYALGTNLGACGIAIRGRSFRLKLNYRTTERIRALAVSVLEGLDFDDLDEGTDTLQGYRSLRAGSDPEVRLLESPQDECTALVAQIERWQEDGALEAICVAARASWALGRYQRALQEAGIPTVQLKNQALAELGAGVRLSTLHRLKGTEFKRVLLCGIQQGLMPLQRSAANYGDDFSEEDFLKQERCLFYVAATRARDELVVLGHGRTSPFLHGVGRLVLSDS